MAPQHVTKQGCKIGPRVRLDSELSAVVSHQCPRRIDVRNLIHPVKLPLLGTEAPSIIHSNN